MNRTQIAERLRLGRHLEAEVTAAGEQRRTFIEVRPMVDDAVASVVHRGTGIEHVLSRRTPNADVIAAYRVRRCTLSPGWEAYPDDWDHYVHAQDWHACPTLQELEQHLTAAFGIGIEALRLPGTTDSPL
ncbi:hypothetical protein [Pseudoduganella albidiflava]|nr:hypothetical protein [Pseudoduganella albidiflava]QBI03058.1 hypothetical protein EYF70_21115 [Pseudoduganella albidiflava]